MTQKSFFELFCKQVQEIYATEIELVKNLPRVINVIHSEELRKNLSHYFQEVQNHLDWIEISCSEFAINFKEANCSTALDILKEAEEILSKNEFSALTDAAFITIIQRLQHYKMSMYGSARTFARHLNINKAMDFFQRSLNEESEADRNLTHLAEGGIFTTGINEDAIKSS